MRSKFSRPRFPAVLGKTPKSAGNISLTLREWGLFCIESRLHGAGGIGVMTINGKIYWACTLYAPAN